MDIEVAEKILKKRKQKKFWQQKKKNFFKNIWSKISGFTGIVLATASIYVACEANNLTKKYGESRELIDSLAKIASIQNNQIEILLSLDTSSDSQLKNLEKLYTKSAEQLLAFSNILEVQRDLYRNDTISKNLNLKRDQQRFNAGFKKVYRLTQKLTFFDLTDSYLESEELEHNIVTTVDACLLIIDDFFSNSYVISNPLIFRLCSALYQKFYDISFDFDYYSGLSKIETKRTNFWILSNLSKAIGPFNFVTEYYVEELKRVIEDIDKLK